jgi:hypothetical protein
MATLADILDANGAIARRMAEKYELRPQQMQMAAVKRAFGEDYYLQKEIEFTITGSVATTNKDARRRKTQYRKAAGLGHRVDSH